VSEDAILVLCGIPPIDLLALEREATYNGRPKEESKSRTLEEWSRRWSASEKGRWTHRLIGDLKAWCQRGHGELNYHLTQALTGHGYFGAYLHRIGKKATSECHHCGDAENSAEHTIFACPAWNEPRTTLKRELGVAELSPEAMVPSMMKDARGWSAWCKYTGVVTLAKEEAHRSRQRAGHQVQGLNRL
jgi:hypothetical protein